MQARVQATAAAPASTETVKLDKFVTSKAEVRSPRKCMKYRSCVCHVPCVRRLHWATTASIKIQQVAQFLAKNEHCMAPVPLPHYFFMILCLYPYLQYEKLYKRSVEDPAGFWADVAEQFYWHKKWDKDHHSYNFDVRKVRESVDFCCVEIEIGCPCCGMIFVEIDMLHVHGMATTNREGTAKCAAGSTCMADMRALGIMSHRAQSTWSGSRAA